MAILLHFPEVIVERAEAPFGDGGRVARVLQKERVHGVAQTAERNDRFRHKAGVASRCRVQRWRLQRRRAAAAEEVDELDAQDDGLRHAAGGLQPA